MIKIGPKLLGFQDVYYDRTIWNVRGNIIFNGRACLGRGISISVNKNASLTCGNDFCMTGKSSIICQKEIVFGAECLISWNVQIIDSDFHGIFFDTTTFVNPPKRITFGDHIWVGFGCTILKGCSIIDNTIIAANSTITKSINEPNCIVGGSGSEIKILKRNINWHN